MCNLVPCVWLDFILTVLYSVLLFIFTTNILFMCVTKILLLLFTSNALNLLLLLFHDHLIASFGIVFQLLLIFIG